MVFSGMYLWGQTCPDIPNECVFWTTDFGINPLDTIEGTGNGSCVNIENTSTVTMFKRFGNGITNFGSNNVTYNELVAQVAETYNDPCGDLENLSYNSVASQGFTTALDGGPLSQNNLNSPMGFDECIREFVTNGSMGAMSLQCQSEGTSIITGSEDPITGSDDPITGSADCEAYNTAYSFVPFA